jgi:hypothetical protein
MQMQKIVEFLKIGEYIMADNRKYPITKLIQAECADASATAIIRAFK